MSLYRLTLTPFRKTPICISLLEEDDYKNSFEKVINSSDSVFSDLSYQLQLEGLEWDDIQSVAFYVNDVLEPCVFKDGIGTFPAKGVGGEKRIFLDSYGFVELSFVISYKDGNELRLHSYYLSVLVRKGELNDSVKAMADYVYKNHEMLLFNGEYKSKDLSGVQESVKKSLDSQIALAEEIAMIYEGSFGYFKANSRFKVEQQNIVDQFDKLQYITTPTLNYIVQHPEQLKKVNGVNGIKYGHGLYQPQKTLTTQNVYSTDIYENRVIVSFLKTMVHTINTLKTVVTSMLERIPKSEIENGEYISSSYFVFSETEKSLKDSNNKLNVLCSKFELLWGHYNQILKTSNIDLIGVPSPSAIFISVPQYNKIYIRIYRWFEYGLYDLSKENFMLSFIRISSLYESYVLAKLINYFKSSGFTLDSMSRCNYPVSDRWKYKNTNHYNTYIFNNQDQVITLYYQPVIFDSDRSYVNNIGLYRNNTISLSDDDYGERRGHYYVPDYIIKIDNAGSVKYIICDAKFSSLSTIHNYYVTSLAYKYIFSISPLSEGDSIAGLCIIYGKCGKENTLQTVYDRQVSSNKIVPFAETLPLMENICSEINLNRILKSLL